MRHGLVAFAFVLAAGLLLDGDLSAGSLEPPGPPAPTMMTISQVEPRYPISSLPITIGASGSYYLTNDLVGGSGLVGINITASFVALDLNGFQLIGVAGSLDGIRAAAGTRHIEIKNGAIRGWGGNGVSAFSSTDVHAEDLRVDANLNSGLAVGAHSIVRNTTASGNGLNGIFGDTGTSVIGCTVRNNASSGISLNGASLATDCTAQLNGTGISVGLGGRIVRSVARANTTGISGTEGVAIEGCNADGNTGIGIRIGNRGLARGNVSRGNGGSGIEATGNETRIEDNESASNGTGIRVNGINNVIVKNSVGSNTTEFIIAAGNKLGPVSADPATAGPWANFDL